MRIETRPPGAGMRVMPAARAAPRHGTPAPDEAGLARIPVRGGIPYFPPRATWVPAPIEAWHASLVPAPIATRPTEP